MNHNQTKKLNRVRISATIFFIVMLVFGFSNHTLYASHVSEITLLTNDLLHHAKQLENAVDRDRQNQMDAITSIIEKRKIKLLELLETNPEAVMHLLLPGDLVKSFPSDIQELLEVEVADLEGTLNIIRMDNFEKGTTTTIHLFQIGDEVEYKLHFVKGIPNLLSGSIIRINGVKIDGNIVLEDGSTDLAAIAAAGGSTSDVTTVSPAAALVSGNQKVVVMRIYFSDSTNICTAADLTTRFFTGSNSVNNYYQDSSFGNVSFSGDVVGPYTIPYPSSGNCNTKYGAWISAADQAATAAGITLSNYNRKFYVFPQTSPSCPYSGAAYVGGSQAWVVGYCNYTGVCDHELGHNLGMYHASTLTAEYGDQTDVMGGAYAGNPNTQNAPHKIQMGWVPTNRVQSVTSSGTYNISLLEQTDGTLIQALKIKKANSSNDYYYFGFRAPVGFDSGLAAGYQNQTQVHRWDGYSNTYFLQSLGDGASFTDSVNGITVNQVSHNATSSTIQVDMYTAPCVKAAPVISVSPITATGSAGQTINYQVQVRNYDSSTCFNTVFNLSAAVPGGWTSTFNPTNFNLAPGALSSWGTWSVTSPTGTPDSTNSITATAMDANYDTAHADDMTVSYVIFTDLIAPTVSITSPANGAKVKGNVTISAQASDNRGVSKVQFYIDQSLVSTDTSSPYSYRWNAQKASAGSHVIKATASDAAGNNTSAQITVLK